MELHFVGFRSVLLTALTTSGEFLPVPVVTAWLRLPLRLFVITRGVGGGARGGIVGGQNHRMQHGRTDGRVPCSLVNTHARTRTHARARTHTHTLHTHTTHRHVRDSVTLVASVRSLRRRRCALAVGPKERRAVCVALRFFSVLVGWCGWCASHTHWCFFHSHTPSITDGGRCVRGLRHNDIVLLVTRQVSPCCHASWWYSSFAREYAPSSSSARHGCAR